MVQSSDMPRLATWRGGDKVYRPFSDAEMRRRQDALRNWMAAHDVDAALFTSYHCINYYSGWLYCGFGRRFGMVITGDAATTISTGTDGGQAWRRSFAENIAYTDWRRGNYFEAVRSLTKGVRRLGIEFDHMNLDFRRELEEALPGVAFVDVARPSMWMRTIKSAEEISLVREGARTADIGGEACVRMMAAGVPEHEVAIAVTDAMIREIAGNHPYVEPMETWAWVQSGLHTDGAHNPVTNRVIEAGDIISLNAFPMIFGYYAALERTLFCEHASDAQLDMWEKNVAVHKRGIELIRPGARCDEIAEELNELYRSWDLLQYRCFGYGHSFGVLSHYYGREAGVELREDVETELKPGMVVSMEPMIMIPEGLPGAGGYREHDILVIHEEGAENITRFPFGPEHNIIRN
ncbi:MAG: aminopeptidase P family protein [bacterium]|nr:aminopeptidase P family protein [bacterium]